MLSITFLISILWLFAFALCQEPGVKGEKVPALFDTAYTYAWRRLDGGGAVISFSDPLRDLLLLP